VPVFTCHRVGELETLTHCEPIERVHVGVPSAAAAGAAAWIDLPQSPRQPGLSLTHTHVLGLGEARHRQTDIQRPSVHLPIDVEIDTRKVKFLSQLSTCKNSLIRLLYQLNGKCELEAIVARHNCSPQCTANQFRCAVFQL